MTVKPIYHRNADLSIHEFCELVGISRPSAYRHLTSGKVPGFKVGGVWRIPREYVDNLRHPEPRAESA